MVPFFLCPRPSPIDESIGPVLPRDNCFAVGGQIDLRVSVSSIASRGEGAAAVLSYSQFGSRQPLDAANNTDSPSGPANVAAVGTAGLVHEAISLPRRTSHCRPCHPCRRIQRGGRREKAEILNRSAVARKPMQQFSRFDAPKVDGRPLRRGQSFAVGRKRQGANARPRRTIGRRPLEPFRLSTGVQAPKVNGAVAAQPGPCLPSGENVRPCMMPMFSKRSQLLAGFGVPNDEIARGLTSGQAFAVRRRMPSPAK